MKLRLPVLPHASPPALWGKLPSHGDFVRYNLRFHWDEAIKEWIRHTFTPLAHHHHTQPSLMGHAGMPWCFILPPGHLKCEQEEYIIGVWIASSDKLGRQYPFIMMQTVSASWIQSYIAHHELMPRDWLFRASRSIARAVYMLPHQPESDPIHALIQELENTWQYYQPRWTQLMQRSAAPSAQADAMPLPDMHPDDFAAHLTGVRHMPQRTLLQDILTHPRALFWQQDLDGRYTMISHTPDVCLGGLAS